MEDQAVGATEAPAEDAAENTESVEAVPAGVDPDAADAPVAEDGDPGGLLAAAFASVGLTSSDKLDEVLSKEEQEAADAAAAEAAEAADEAEADEAEAD
ncbi:MAG: hypothetical protein HKO70_02535, partial [Acidimicrobiia bacterium]|nr:hypothetical protein [Acidimicrobiia bacterium]